MTWVFYAFLGAVFAALVSIFAKIGIKNIDVTLATTVRGIIMAVFLVFVSLGLGKWNGELFSQIKARDWMFITLAGIAGALSWLFGFWALKNGSAGAVSAIDRLSIVFIVIFAALFLGEAFTWKIGLGATLVAVGAYLIVMK